MAEQTSQKPGSSYLRTNMKSLKTLAQNHVFLSYSSLDIALAEEIDANCYNYGGNIIRDVRCQKPPDNVTVICPEVSQIKHQR